MKIKILCCCGLFSLAIFLCGCASCFKKTSYPFHYDESEIKSISIVYTLEGYDYNSYNYETLVEIEDIDDFLSKFKEIQFGRYLFGDPSEIAENEYAILVKYNNGDFEFINNYAQDIIIDGELWFGIVYCSEEEFENFINSYLTDSP